MDPRTEENTYILFKLFVRADWDGRTIGIGFINKDTFPSSFLADWFGDDYDGTCVESLLDLLVKCDPYQAFSKRPL